MENAKKANERICVADRVMFEALRSVQAARVQKLWTTYCYRFVGVGTIVATDISQAAILLIFTSFGHLSLGTVDWSLVLPIWLGTVAGVLVGAKLCQSISQGALRFVVYAVLMVMSWKLVY